MPDGHVARQADRGIVLVKKVGAEVSSAPTIVIGMGYFANTVPQYGQFFQSVCTPRPQEGQG